MPRPATWLSTAVCLLLALMPGRSTRAATELRLDRDFLTGVVEQLPPSPFEKPGQYRGNVHTYRLLGIDAGRRRFLAACQVEGEFRPPVSGPVSERVSQSKEHTPGLRRFRFDIRAGVNIEAGPDSMPRFRVDVEEVKRAELEGMAGLLAKLLGRFFDDLATQIAAGRASLLSRKLNDEIVKRAAGFQHYGAFCGIDYAPDQVILHFDLTRFKPEGIVGYVFTTAQPGTVPLYRSFDRRTKAHEFSTSPNQDGRADLVREGIACYVPAHSAPGALPVQAWHGRKDRIYTTSPDGEGLARQGFRSGGIVFFIQAKATPGAVPLYRFLDPRHGLHFYTTHPHAEFAK